MSSAKEIATKARCYVVELSNGRKIKCDADEVYKVIEGIQTGGVVKLRQGMFNPSFYVDTVEDEERLKEFRSNVYEVEKHNKQDIEYHSGKDQRKLPSGMQSLKDIFEGTKLKALPASETKKLN